MSDFKIELNSAGIQALLKSAEIMAALEEPAEKIRGTMGDAFAIDRHIGQNRGNVSVYTTDAGAMRKELQNNRLLKAMGSVNSH